MSEPEIFEQIRKDLSENDVVLYMKGNAKMPMCGFSAAVVSILNQLGVPFKDINVLASNELRDGIKAFTDWPTIPQLYVQGEFIGGCAIVKEMYQAGELQQLLQEKAVQ